jgi:hypothetical protein
VLTLYVFGREVVAIRWRAKPPDKPTAEPTAESATNGSGLGGAFERGPAAAAMGRQFGFRL